MTNITDQLPYELCDGVVATVKGLRISKQAAYFLGRYVEGRPCLNEAGWSWGKARAVFRYRSMEPFVLIKEDSIIVKAPIDIRFSDDPFCYGSNHNQEHLHWHSFFLCNPRLPQTKAEAFRVLYQCIKEFGDES